MSNSYNNFKNQVLGKGFDIDGAYGNQCWDGFAKYMQYLGYPVYHCTQSGYVKDIWNLRKRSGILNYTKEVEVMQAGDIAIFGEYPVTPYSHIAIFDHDIDGKNGVFLGENQGAPNGVFNLVTLPYSATIGALRPNAYVKDSQEKPQVWDSQAVLRTGDTVTAFNLAITGVQGNCVNIPALGGLVPLVHVYENKDKSKDGNATDDYLANTNAVVNLYETTVQDIDAKNDLVMIHGYWVKAGPLSKRVG